MAPTTQKALLLLEKQGSYAVRDYEVYKPGPGELLVQIISTGLNPVDWKIQTTGLFIDTYPAILGTDSSGVVVEVGEGVTDFKVGDKVVHQGTFRNREATFQQYTVVPAEITAKLPSNLSHDQGATIPLALATAAFGLYSTTPTRGAGLVPAWKAEGRGKYAGQPILVIGGSSAVGQQVIQLARLSGFSPIITTASPRNEAFLKSLGATHVIDRSAPLAEAVKAVTSEPVTIIYDAISVQNTQVPAWEVLAPGGKFILVLPPAIDAAKIEEAKKSGTEVLGVFGTPFDPAQRELGKDLYKHFTALFESGDLKPNNVEVVPNGLEGIPDGLEKLKTNQVSAAKLIAHPQEST